MARTDRPLFGLRSSARPKPNRSWLVVLITALAVLVACALGAGALILSANPSPSDASPGGSVLSVSHSPTPAHHITPTPTGKRYTPEPIVSLTPPPNTGSPEPSGAEHPTRTFDAPETEMSCDPNGECVEIIWCDPDDKECLEGS